VTFKQQSTQNAFQQKRDSLNQYLQSKHEHQRSQEALKEIKRYPGAALQHPSRNPTAGSIAHQNLMNAKTKDNDTFNEGEIMMN